VKKRPAETAAADAGIGTDRPERPQTGVVRLDRREAGDRAVLLREDDTTGRRGERPLRFKSPDLAEVTLDEFHHRAPLGRSCSPHRAVGGEEVVESDVDVDGVEVAAAEAVVFEKRNRPVVRRSDSGSEVVPRLGGDDDPLVRAGRREGICEERRSDPAAPVSAVDEQNADERSAADARSSDDPVGENDRRAWRTEEAAAQELLVENPREVVWGFVRARRELAYGAAEFPIRGVENFDLQIFADHHRTHSPVPAEFCSFRTRGGTQPNAPAHQTIYRPRAAAARGARWLPIRKERAEESVAMSSRIIRCPECGKANRVGEVGPGRKALCGECRVELPERAAPVVLTDTNFEQFTRSAGAVVVDFWAAWCGPCRTIAPLIEQLAAERDDVSFAKLNVDENPATASRLRISGIPTLVFLRDGAEKGRLVGAAGKPQIEAAIRQHLV
jgi:thioredoxin